MISELTKEQSLKENKEKSDKRVLSADETEPEIPPGIEEPQNASLDDDVPIFYGQWNKNKALPVYLSY